MVRYSLRFPLHLRPQLPEPMMNLVCPQHYDRIPTRLLVVDHVYLRTNRVADSRAVGLHLQVVKVGGHTDSGALFYVLNDDGSVSYKQR
jgi:hypothetical protein